MSNNRSRLERTSDSTQYRPSGRPGNSNLNRSFSGNSGRGGGGGSAPPPSSSSLSSNRSFNLKKSNYAPGGQTRASGSAVITESSGNSFASRPSQNGAHMSPSLQGAFNAPVNTASGKPTDLSTQKVNRALPKSPASSVAATVGTEATAPSTPAKGDTPKSFPLQFGSISPGLMNGMQIPARTSSAPPNLDEQKRDQARHDTSRAAPSPSIPKQLPRKDVGAVDQSNSGEAQATSKIKKDIQVSAALPSIHTHKPSVHGLPMISMSMPFHQPHVPSQFGAPNAQIQSQGVTAASLPVPMGLPLTVGNPAQVQPQLFVSGLQPHPMQAQGLIHQGQGLNFSSPMAHQLPQLNNMGIGGSQQFSQQQPGKLVSARKAVKITHPETREELSFDKRSDTHMDSGSGSSGPRSHSSVPPQPQPISSFPPGHAINYYPNTYSASPLFYPTQNALPLNSTQLTTCAQAPRFYNQVTVKPAASSSAEKVADPVVSVTSTAVEKSDSPRFLKTHGESSPTCSQRDFENRRYTQQSKSGHSLTSSKHSAAVSGSFPADGSALDSASSVSPGAVNDPTLVPSCSGDGTGRETTSISDSIKDERNKLMKKEHSFPQNQVGGKTTLEMSSTQNLPTSRNDEDVSNSASSGISKVASEGVKEFIPIPAAVSSDSFNNKESHWEVAACEPSSVSDVGNTFEKQNTENMGTKSKSEALLHEGEKPLDGSKTSLKSLSIESSDEVVKTKKSLESGLSVVDEYLDSCVEDDKVVQNSRTLTSPSGGKTALDTSVSHNDKLNSKEVDDIIHIDSLLGSVPSALEATLKCEGENNEVIVTGFESLSVSGLKEKPLVEQTRGKSNLHRRRQRKEMFQKADAASPTSDLFTAYKGSEEKKENSTSSESTQITPSSSSEQVSAGGSLEDAGLNKKDDQMKAEREDWEDDDEITTPKFEISDHGKVHRDLKHCEDDSNVSMAKKYSRDFLLKFADQCTDLPEGFEITPDVTEVLLFSNFSTSHEPHTGSGRVIDRQTGGSRVDRRGSGLADDDRWNKLPIPVMSGRDIRSDIGYGAHIVGFRPAQGGNFGMVRNPRVQTPVYSGGGILAGPMPTMGHQGSMLRISPDSDRWPRATAFHKGLIPSPPQTPSQMMHKAEKKYEVGKITDEEQGKQRQLKAILNKLTPQNFEKLFEQVKQVNIDNSVTLLGVISQIFDKALMEPTFCEMYANFCSHLAVALPELIVDNEKITFKRLLLNECQEEFERGEREQEEANKADEGEAKLSEEEREEKRVRARRRMLGNIRLIGELYKKKMLTERIMHECIQKLLGQHQSPDEEDVEALCKLMSTIGDMIDHPRSKVHMDGYFDAMLTLSNNNKLSSRVRFMLKDAIDLRKNKWQQRRKVEGPKKIEEVHRDAAQERQAQASRLARAPSISSSARRGGQPMEYSSRGPNMLSPSSTQVGSFRGMSPHLRGYGAQDVRMEDRHLFENRTMSIPLTQRPIADDSITLGPQGGLAKGMSFRGHLPLPSASVNDIPSPVDSRRVISGLNGYSSVERGASYMAAERYMGSNSDPQDRGFNYGNRDIRNMDQSIDRPGRTSPPTRGQGSSFVQNVPAERAFGEERLRDMSLLAIREFYSAKDEGEVALCVKDLKSPSFYPMMISIWVTDSFERKESEMNLLVKLLINLFKSGDIMITQDQLIKGFESVLVSLEDAVNDAPRAAEFLGRIFAKVIIEDIVPLTVIGRLIYEGGENQGRLVEIGLAAEVLGSIFDTIKMEKGDSFLGEVRSKSNLRLEDFHGAGSNKSRRLDKYI